MPKTIPRTLKDAIDEEPDRFLSYLDLEKIFTSSNPYQEFLRQFEKAFNHRQGLNLWQYVFRRYLLLNKLYKSKILQEKLPQEFRGSLSRKETNAFWERYVRRISEKQKETEIKIKKPIKVVGYIRKGKKIRSYVKTKPLRYSNRQERFILARKDYPLRQLVDEFNRAFGTKLTYYAIRDKRLRLLGRKK